MDQKHELLTKLKAMIDELDGRVPTRAEFRARHGEQGYIAAFGPTNAYTAFLASGGYGVGKASEKKQKPFKFKFEKRTLESFSFHEVGLEDLFARANLGPGETLRVVCMPDTHVQYADHDALRCFLAFVAWYKPHVFIIMGDFIDAEGISHWPQADLAPRVFSDELIIARKVLTEIAAATEGCLMRIYLEGNHENWIAQAMAQKMPNFFFGLDEMGIMPDLKKCLDLDRFGYQLIPMNHLFQLGKALYTHGLFCGANHQKKHLDTVKWNIYYGHTHDEMNLHQPTHAGTIEAASMGCLCRLDAKFLKGKPNNWVHGFGLFEFFEDGNYTSSFPKIFKGRLSHSGRTF